MRETASGDVTAVAADVTTADGQALLLAACPSPDILVNNNAGPSPGNFADIERDRWLATIEANMIAPLMLVRAVLPAMKERRFGRIVNITSAMVTTPRPHMTLSSGARGGLTAAMKGEITIQNGRVAQHHFNDYEMIRHNEAPEVEVHIVPSTADPGGIGEPSTAIAAGALANAIAAATGKRIYKLPLRSTTPRA